MVPGASDSLAPARSALAGLHLRSNSFRRFPSGSSPRAFTFPAFQACDERSETLKRKIRPGVGIGDFAGGGDDRADYLAAGCDVVVCTVAADGVFDDDVVA